MNKCLLEYTGSLLLDGKYIVSPYGISKDYPRGEIVPLSSSNVHNNSISPVSIDYRNTNELTIVNGLGVTLGDSIVGISSLQAIKKINPDITINVIRPEHCPDYVNQIYSMAEGVVDSVKYMPLDISNISCSGIMIDMGNQLYWERFDQVEMHDFFLENLGLNPADVNINVKNNSWLKDVKFQDINLGDYVLFCPTASTKIRSIPSKYHVKIVDELSERFGVKVFGFVDVEHHNYINISSLSKDTRSFSGIVKHAKYLYTCDSSTLHLGAGFGIPTTCIFTSIRPELRSLYYNECESVYLGNSETEGVHNSEDERLIKLLNDAFEVFYA